MKKSKRIAALLTAALLAMAPCALAGMTAFAADPVANSISITAAKEGTHDYAAYQIFKGDLSGTGAVDDPATTEVNEADPYVLSNIQWGDNAADDFLTELKKDTAFNLVADPENPDAAKTSIFADATTAAQVADILSKYSDNSDVAIAFAKFAGNHLKGTKAGSDNTSPYKIDELAAGYYLVRDEAEITDEVENPTPRTLNMLKVAGAVSMTTKEDYPTLTKEIDEEGGIEANTASIGDKVPFILKSKVPDMTGYTKYFFVMNDTLSEGLTYNNDMLVTVNGIDVTDKCTITSSGTTNIKIVFNDFYNEYKSLNDTNPNNDDIVVKYSATVNANANMTQDGNVNTAQLTYSNNPNETATPDGDEPNNDSPVGKTPVEKTVTYVTQIDITKVKPNGEGTAPLAGVEFTLEGYKKTVGVSEGTYFMADEAGTYYRLKDGTYKLVSEFVAGTDEYYDSTTTKYKEVAVENIPATEKITLTATSDSDGKINFKGLGEGVYTITETKTPAGFNQLSPFTVTITADATLSGCTWGRTGEVPSGVTARAFVQGTKTDGETAATPSYLPLTILNTEGNTLPSTGGMGTKLFYLIGSLLAAGSGVVLVTKKRMANTEK